MTVHRSHPRFSKSYQGLTSQSDWLLLACTFLGWCAGWQLYFTLESAWGAVSAQSSVLIRGTLRPSLDRVGKDS